MKTVFILFSILLSFASCNTDSREEENQSLKIYTLTAANGNSLPFKSIYTDSVGYDTVWTAIGSSGMLTLSTITKDYDLKFNTSSGFITGAIKSAEDKVYSDQGTFEQTRDTLWLKSKGSEPVKPRFLIIKNGTVILTTKVWFDDEKNLESIYELEFR
ncbi:MAG: hypothetical protein J0L62_02855 [Bacteroidetes bacterium]|nr:hypothetical protein [Bacteroidota bacterium]